MQLPNCVIAGLPKLGAHIFVKFVNCVLCGQDKIHKKKQKNQINKNMGFENWQLCKPVITQLGNCAINCAISKLNAQLPNCVVAGLPNLAAYSFVNFVLFDKFVKFVLPTQDKIHKNIKHMSSDMCWAIAQLIVQLRN